MWTLRHIHAINLCAFKTLDYTPNTGHTTLIFGNNRDNDSQGSNGSGKSALIEAIAIGLTGEPLRKVKMEEIVNDAENETVICLILYNGSTGQTMEVSRHIFRKQPQTVKVLEYKGPKTDDQDHQVHQASVADYNRYILEAIGLTKDDLYANFILCRNKFTSFLSCSDREKKEIINRFSNGNLVDESIAILQTDMQEVQKELDGQNTAVAVLQGKTETLKEQIETAVSQTADRKRRAEEQMAEWKQRITEKTASIREHNSSIRALEERRGLLEDVTKETEQLEDSAKGLKECYDELKRLVTQNSFGSFPDYTARLEELNGQLRKLAASIALSDRRIKDMEKTVEDAMAEQAEAEAAHTKAAQERQKGSAELKRMIEEYGLKLAKEQEAIRQLRSDRTSLSKDLAVLEGRLAGRIICPKCQHEFLLGSDDDVDRLKQDLEDGRTTMKEIDSEIQGCERAADGFEKAEQHASEQMRMMAVQEKGLADVMYAAQARSARMASELKKAEQEREAQADEVNRTVRQIDRLRTNLFDIVFTILEQAGKRISDDISRHQLAIESADAAIETYQDSLKALKERKDTDLTASLKESLEKYEAELAAAEQERKKTAERLNAYKVQEALFGEFKTYLANTKIEALNHITNGFLESIGSDIRISFSGYTTLKSGKTRDKISISLLRDGTDCGSFDKFSAGERARVELASILAMHTLTNTDCDDGKGLDLLVLDEILEAVDEQGLSSIFDALNRLEVTALVVSHGNIAEGYPYRTVVSKLNGISYIDER